jgi:Rieske Fe-S protein
MPALPTGTPEASMSPLRGGAWVVLEADASVAAFVPICPYERCLYDWDGASARFACRCHRGYFAVDGRVISGPPPRPLSRYEVRQAGADTIEIAWTDRS